MISYLDRTFCAAPCSHPTCSRKLTPAISQAAKLWWEPCSGAAPIAVADFSETCKDFIKDIS